MKLLLPAAFSTMHISPGGKQEMFSLPFQMTARYVREHGDDITPEEYAVLDKVLYMDTIADSYNPTFADPVKGYSQKGEDKDYLAYVAVFFRQGLRHPDSYLKAFNSMLAGWFSWYEYDPLISMIWQSQHDTALIPEWVGMRGRSESTANAYQEYCHAMYNNPLVRLFLSYGFYSALIPAFAAGTVFRKDRLKKGYWLAILPALLSLALGCWLAPASILFEGRRYLYPLTYTAPLLISWCAYVSSAR